MTRYCKLTLDCLITNITSRHFESFSLDNNVRTALMGYLEGRSLKRGNLILCKPLWDSSVSSVLKIFAHQ